MENYIWGSNNDIKLKDWEDNPVTIIKKTARYVVPKDELEKSSDGRSIRVQIELPPGDNGYAFTNVESVRIFGFFGLELNYRNRSEYLLNYQGCKLSPVLKKKKSTKCL